MRINPNNFITFDSVAHTLNGKRVVKNISMTLPWKRIMSLESISNNFSIHVHNLANNIVTYEVTQNTYNRIKSQLENVDFSIPVTNEDVKESKESEVETIKDYSAISTLEL